MQAEAWHAVGIHGVGSGKQGNAGAEHHAHELLVRIENAAVKFKFLMRPAAEAEVVRGIPAATDFTAHVSDARVGGEMAIVHVAKGAMDGEGRNLPCRIAAELGEERLAARGVERAEAFGNGIHFFEVAQGAKLLNEA